MLDRLIETCVHRRVAAILAIAIVSAFGVRAYLNTPIEAFPDVTNAQVTVITQNPGYAPEEIERSITVPLERALNGTPRTIQLRSESLFGLSLITLTFDDDADPFTSRMQVAQRMAAAMSDLPEGVVPELGPEATPLGEVYQFRMVSDRHDLYQQRGELQWTVTRVLKAVPGVADVVCFGGYLKEIHVRAYPDRLRAHGVSLTELSDALAKTNVNVGGGFLRHGDQELTVRGIGYITSVEDLRRTVLQTPDATPVTVGAVSPLALLGAFTGLYILKMPANLISMGAIDFGILVDGAVVLVESVMHAIQHDRPERRRDVLRLIIRAAEQVARPTLFAMLIIIAALVPVFTLEQVEGRIFRPLALTYSFALVSALVLALTLVPALCALGLARGRAVSEPLWVEKTRTRYRAWLGRALGRRRLALAPAAGFFVLTIRLGTRPGTQFLPELDEGDFVVFVEM